MKITKSTLKRMIKEELDADQVPEMYEDWNSYNIRKFLGGVASVRPKDLNSDPEAAGKIHQLEDAAADLADEFKGDMKKYSTLHATTASELGNYWADEWFPGHGGDEDLPPEAEKDVADDLRSIANRLGGMQGEPVKDIEAMYDRFNESKFNKSGAMMKITKNTLKQLIKEELAKVLGERGIRRPVPERPEPERRPDPAPVNPCPGDPPSAFHYILYDCGGAPEYLDGKPFLAPADSRNWVCTPCDKIHPGKTHPAWAAWAAEIEC